MKYSQTLALFSLAAISSTVEAGPQIPRVLSYSDQASYEHDTELMQWYLEAVRGLWFGFYRGFYHERKRPQSTCLSSNVEEEMTEIMQFFAYGELADIFHVADSMTNLYYDNRLGCGYQEIIKTISAHCAATDTEEKEDNSTCKMGTLFNNLFTVHMIETLGSTTTLANSFKELELDVEQDVIHDQMLGVGKSAGQLLAFAYDI